MSSDTDIETDTSRIAQQGPPYPRSDEEELHNQLIEINEEFCSEELEVLKFLCYDILPASKLENADSALSIFENLKKGNKLTHTNVDILLECLWWMHRKDLIRKLGFDPKEVEPFISGLHQILPFRKLLLELREDITDKEFNTLQFYLDGKVKKKKLQDKKNMMELFIFLEREGLISHDDPKPLITLMKTIKRADLVDLVKDHYGKPVKPNPTRVPPPGSSFQGQRNPQGQDAHSVTDDRNRRRIISPAEPQVERQMPVGGGQGRRAEPVLAPSGDRRPGVIDRSASAGTMSAPSSLENEQGAFGEGQGILPDQLLRHVSLTVKDLSDDFGIELGFSNPDIATYERVYPDPAERCFHMIKHWQNMKLDQGQVGPGLRYALEKLGYKQTSKIVGDWLSEYAAGTQPPPQQQGNQTVGSPDHRVDPVFRPAGPPVEPRVGPPEPPNNYTSLIEAQLVNTEPMQQTGEILQQMGIVSDPKVASLLPANLNLEDIRSQLQHISVNPAAAMNPGVTMNPGAIMNPGAPNAGNQIPPLDQHPMYNAVIGEPALVGQGQVQGQAGGDNQMEEDLMSIELPVYPMNASPKGVCVIINNRNFIVAANDPQSKEMPERRGTDVDASNLQELFRKLDFVVEYHENLTDTGMMQLLVDVAHNIDHKDYDCFVCCILSHGVLSHLYGTNGRLVPIKDLTSVFQTNRCPSLAGKPKLFFLQACQGRDKMAGGEIERDACPPPGNLNENVETDNNDREMIPNESDFLVGYATVPGYVSFRSRNHGSWYIRKLCELVEKYSERHDLLSILVKVNEEVARGNAHVDGGIFKQTPAPVVTLRKKLYFFPPNRRAT